MDKPVYLAVKDYLIRKMAVKMMIPEKTIEAVINHQFKAANEALRTNESVEISGFGRFFFNKKRAYKRMQKLLNKKKTFEHILATDTLLSEQRRTTINLIISNTIDDINVLKPKIDEAEFQSYLRGLEKQAVSSRTLEGDDSKSE